MPIPTKLFNVSNGNNVVESGLTIPAATLIAFRDGAAKNKIIDAVANAGQYQATLPDGSPNPQSKQQFFNKFLETTLRDIFRNDAISAAAKTAGNTAGAAADADLP